jgi:hypothetical protein
MKQVIIIWVLLVTNVGMAQSAFEALAIIQLPPAPQNPKSPTCDEVLQDCISTVKAQDEDIARLKQDSKQLESALAKDNSPLLPWYAWVGIGVIAGGVAGIELKGGH